MLTDIVRSVRDQGLGCRQQRVQLRRLPSDQPAEALGERVGIVKREVEEGDGQERGRTEVEGHDPVVAVLHEIAAVHVRLTEAQAMGHNLGPEVDTLMLLCDCQNLRQEVSSEDYQ
jgi:hypothetical protein